MQQTELTRQNLINYRQRWQAVAAVEAAELQSATLSERWQQLNALFALALRLNILPQATDIILDEGQQRWQALYAQNEAK